MFKKILLGAALCSVLVGCMEGGFSEHYTPVMMPSEVNVARCTGDPRVQRFPRGSDREIIQMMTEKGYVLIGEASWTGPAYEDDSSALSQGKKVGACLVVWGRAEVGQRLVTRSVDVHVPAETVIVRERHRGGRTVEKTIEKPSHYETQYVQETVTDYSYKGMFFAQRAQANMGVEPDSVTY